MEEKKISKKSLDRLMEGSVRFDASNYLADNPKEQDAFLKDCWNHPDPEVFLNALSIVAKAHGISATARDAGMARSGLNKALSKAGNPRYATLKGIFNALGIEVDFRRFSAHS